MDSTRSTDSLINKLIIYAVHRGLLTSIFAALNLFFVRWYHAQITHSLISVLDVVQSEQFLVLNWIFTRQRV